MNARKVTPRSLAELLNAICEFLRRFVVFQHPEQAEVCALWIVHTWTVDAADFTPYLNVWAASKRSGKSRLLEVINLLCRSPRLTSGGSSAALIRSVDEENPPTLLIDEVDAIYSKKSDAEAENTRQFLNAGYRRGAKFLRCVGQGADLKVGEFPAFCPKAFAGIGRSLPDTVQDRCLPLELVRQSGEEKAERFRERDATAAAAPIRTELEALAQQSGIIDALRAARPNLPEELNDRLQDISEPLLALADMAGGHWPHKARIGLVKLCGQEEDADLGVRLLAAIKSIFDSTGADKLTTKGLIEALVDIEDGPWASMFEDALKHDRLQTAASRLVRMLKDYKIKPHTLKLDDGTTAKGYHRADYEPHWKRYLTASRSPSEEAVTAVTAVTHEGKKVTAPVAVTATGETAVTPFYEGKMAKGDEVTAVTAPERQEQKGLWQTVLAKIPAKGFLRMLSELVRPIGIDGHKFLLGYSPENRKKIEVLTSVSNRRQLETLLREASGRDWSLEICSDPIRGSTGICLHELAQRDFPKDFEGLALPI